MVLRQGHKRKVVLGTVTDSARERAALVRKDLGLSPHDNIFVRDPRKIVKTKRGEEKGSYIYIDDRGDEWEISKIDAPGYSIHKKWVFRLSEDAENDLSGRRSEMAIHDTFNTKKDAVRALSRYLKNRAYSTEYGWVELGPSKKGINVISLK